MKTFLILALAFLAIAANGISRAAIRGGDNFNKAELVAKKHLLKLRSLHAKPTEVAVPELATYELKEVALIEDKKTLGNQKFEYVAVYKNRTGSDLKVVLYDAKSIEQLTIEGVKSVTFDNQDQVSRIILERTSASGEMYHQALVVPGQIQVAQKG